MEYGLNWQGINMDLIEEGWTDEERNDYQNVLIEKYECYCEENDIETEID